MYAVLENGKIKLAHPTQLVCEAFIEAQPDPDKMVLINNDDIRTALRTAGHFGKGLEEAWIRADHVNQYKIVRHFGEVIEMGYAHVV